MSLIKESIIFVMSVGELACCCQFVMSVGELANCCQVANSLFKLDKKNDISSDTFSQI